MINDNQTVTSYDPAETLANEDGLFLLQRAGQSFLVECKKEHSIVWGPTPTGAIEAVTVAGNPPFSISRIPEARSRRAQGANQQSGNRN